MELGINIEASSARRSIARNNKHSIGRSRDCLTRKIHVVVDTNGLPMRLGVPAIGQVERG
jgi:hypothetical protein